MDEVTNEKLKMSGEFLRVKDDLKELFTGMESNVSENNYISTNRLSI
jgi:hypothetical protein